MISAHILLEVQTRPLWVDTSSNQHRQHLPPLATEDFGITRKCDSVQAHDGEVDWNILRCIVLHADEGECEAQVISELQ